MTIEEKLKMIKEMIDNEELIIYNSSDPLDRGCFYIGREDLDINITDSDFAKGAIEICLAR